MCAARSLSRVRVISFDVTGTLIRHRDPIFDTYATAAVWANFPNAPSSKELKPAFKQAYYETLMEAPCFGHQQGHSSKQWWVRCVKRCLELSGRKEGVDYATGDFNRFFRRVYQHYGCPEGYVPMADALPFVRWATGKGYLLGVTTNTPSRTMDSVLPFMGLHHFLRYFVCSQDAGQEKPHEHIFNHALGEMEFYRKHIASHGIVESILPYNVVDGAELRNEYQQLAAASRSGAAIEPGEVLHVGDSLASDYCGARAAGWEALWLDRSNDPNVRQYQDWLKQPEYPGKSEEDMRANTVSSLDEVRQRLEASGAR